MKQAFSGKFGKKQTVFFLLYAIVLIGGYDALEWSLRYEVIAQPFYTLWPVFALTAAIVLVVLCALLLAARVPLSLLLGLHVLAAGWWLTSAQLRAGGQGNPLFQLQWVLLVPMLLNCLPPLLGWALLRLRYAFLKKQRAGAVAETGVAGVGAGADAGAGAMAEAEAGITDSRGGGGNDTEGSGGNA